MKTVVFFIFFSIFSFNALAKKIAQGDNLSLVNSWCLGQSDLKELILDGKGSIRAVCEQSIEAKKLIKIKKARHRVGQINNLSLQENGRYPSGMSLIQCHFNSSSDLVIQCEDGLYELSDQNSLKDEVDIQKKSFDSYCHPLKNNRVQCNDVNKIYRLVF